MYTHISGAHVSRVASIGTHANPARPSAGFQPRRGFGPRDLKHGRPDFTSFTPLSLGVGSEGGIRARVPVSRSAQGARCPCSWRPRLTAALRVVLSSGFLWPSAPRLPLRLRWFRGALPSLSTGAIGQATRPGHCLAVPSQRVPHGRSVQAARRHGPLLGARHPGPEAPSPCPGPGRRERRAWVLTRGCGVRLSSDWLSRPSLSRSVPERGGVLGWLELRGHVGQGTALGAGPPGF